MTEVSILLALGSIDTGFSDGSAQANEVSKRAIVSLYCEP